MSKFLYTAFALFLISTPDLSAQQVNIVNPVLNKPDTNVIFTGLKNRLHVQGVDQGTTLKATDDSGNTYDIGSDMTFRISPKEGISQVIITIIQGTNEIYEKEYDVVRFPDPIVCIGTSNSDTMSREEILQNPNLLLRANNNLLNPNRFLKITKFEVLKCHEDDCNSVTHELAPGPDTVIVQDPETQEFYMEVGLRTEAVQLTNFNNPFRAELLEAIKNSKPGDRLIFDNIRATSPDGEGRKLAPLTIWIRD